MQILISFQSTKEITPNAAVYNICLYYGIQTSCTQCTIFQIPASQEILNHKSDPTVQTNIVVGTGCNELQLDV
jgi:hypothetical protein